MLKKMTLLGLCLSISACATPEDPDRARQIAAALAQPCENTANPNCIFINSPVALTTQGVQIGTDKRAYFQTVNRLEFIDGQSRRWVAPKSTFTDGASIPNIFISMIGARMSAEFANAAAIHDAYCGFGNEKGQKFHDETWQNVHRMFYSALRIGGTPAAKAKIMYSAVYLGGPRWTAPKRPTALGFRGERGFNAVAQRPTLLSRLAPQPPRSFGKVATSAMQNQLARAIEFIETTAPSLHDLDAFLATGEAAALRDTEASEGHGDTASPGYGPSGSV